MDFSDIQIEALKEISLKKKLWKVGRRIELMVSPSTVSTEHI